MASLDVLLRTYRMVEFLAHRGGAWFYRARRIDDPTAGDRLLRIYSPARSQQAAPDIVDLAQRLRGLQHPQLVPLHDAGEYADPVKRRFLRYTVEAYFEPELMLQVQKDLPQEELLPIARVMDLLGDLSGVLNVLEAAGTYHGGLYPSSIVLGLDGRVSLVHPLVARLMTVPRERHEEERIEKATVADFCRAPELDQGGGPGIQADIYAVGAIVFYLLTGRMPLAAPQTRVVAELGAPDPRLLRPDLPHGLVAIVIQALQQDRARRYATARQLAEDCYQLLEGSPPDHALAALGDRLGPAEQPAVGTTTRRRRRATAAAEETARAGEAGSRARRRTTLTGASAGGTEGSGPGAIPARQQAPPPWLPWAIGGGLVVLVLLTIALAGVIGG